MIESEGDEWFVIKTDVAEGDESRHVLSHVPIRETNVFPVTFDEPFVLCNVSGISNSILDEIQGFCTLKMENGDIFSGQMKAGLRDGSGICRSTNGSVTYSGHWVLNKRNSWGIEQTERELYCGEWKNDMKHGFGHSESSAFGIYDGQFNSNLRSGQGKMKYSDGSTYTGEWHMDKRHGAGVFETAEGDKYVGSWDSDMKHGTFLVTTHSSNGNEQRKEVTYSYGSTVNKRRSNTVL